MTRAGYPWARAALGSLAAIMVFGAALPAMAAWSAHGTGSAAGAGALMPSGEQPTVSASGSSITVRWPAAALANGVDVAGYTISRYNSSTGAVATVGSGCSGVVAATTCTEVNVPAGSWVYTDTPAQVNWTGGQSAESAPVVISS